MRAPTLVGRPGQDESQCQLLHLDEYGSMMQSVRTGVEGEDHHPVDHVVGPLEASLVRR